LRVLLLRERREGKRGGERKGKVKGEGTGRRRTNWGKKGKGNEPPN